MNGSQNIVIIHQYQEKQSIYKYNQCPEPMPSLITKHSPHWYNRIHSSTKHALKIYKTTIYIQIYCCTTTLRCINTIKNKINKLRLNCALLARRMINLTNLLHQENSYTHQCIAITFYQKTVKLVIRSHLDNKYIYVLYFISFHAKHKIFII